MDADVDGIDSKYACPTVKLFAVMLNTTSLPWTSATSTFVATRASEDVYSPKVKLDGFNTNVGVVRNGTGVWITARAIDVVCATAIPKKLPPYIVTTY